MATSEESFLARRIDGAAAPLAVVDLLALAAVLTIGVINHNSVGYLSADPAGWLLTLVPFLVGWAVAGPLIGAYSAGAAESAKAAIPLAIRAWIPGAVIGFALRASPAFSGGFQLTFGAVMLVTGGLALVVGRWLFFKIVG
ncbi:DUF3054 domain-containing protein [Halobellus clavatus]|jgi:hypothetical protein|uniref:DUF3054 domain-containing protein n=1 Tax=Halobellus clavatus TaxID=660517 RepID=A0A1H3H519_9EURY|nr:DUF3054 domain-containing protein [Halobellus clavatus]SDY10606.1 Protein of unknown function [Halobellus clavatus]